MEACLSEVDSWSASGSYLLRSRLPAVLRLNSSNISIGSAPLLIGELAYPQHRGKLTTLYNTLWYVGSIIAAWTVFGTIKYTGDVSWRVPVALQALMPLLQLFGIYLLPESPRWLCSKDRDDEAMKVLVKVDLRSDSGRVFN